MNEVWKPVTGWEGLYEVSSLGRVRRGESVLSGWVAVQGYRMVNLCEANPTRRQVIGIHRLVCQAFLGIDEARNWVNHKNSDRTDNRLENLEWVTPQENVDHMVAAGRYRNGFAGKRKPKAKLSDDQIRSIRRRAKFIPSTVIAEDVGVSASLIQRIVARKFYKYVD